MSTDDLFGHDELTILRTGEADVTYLAAFLDATDADAALDAAVRESYRQDQITVHGRTHPIPRLTQWYSTDGSRYTYSGIAMDPRPYPTFVAELAARVSHHTGLAFNSVLINVYRHGRDKVGWHSDDEKELGAEINVASISLGARRSFKLRHRRDHSTVHELSLAHGSLLIMRHPTQLHWQHCIPPRAGVKRPRYNLTFRSIAH